eukprot:GHVP01038984.1.p2 GENE.GHVP01038984.1~~GHVP01038984.1.p2  ORF type:complete len:242 (+),score=45.41 GHVP01038984.1:26-751(+)
MWYPAPTAQTLTVKILTGRDLPGKTFGTPDPYVKIFLVGGEEKKTSVKKGTNVRWDETFVFTYRNEPTLRLAVWDDNLLGDSYMGVGDFECVQTLKDPKRRFEGEIMLSSNKGRGAGYVRVFLDFEPKPDGAKQKKEEAQLAPPSPIIINNPTPAPPVVYQQPPQPQMVYQPAPPQVVYQPPPPVLYQPPPQMQSTPGVTVVVQQSPQAPLAPQYAQQARGYAPPPYQGQIPGGYPPPPSY